MFFNAGHFQKEQWTWNCFSTLYYSANGTTTPSCDIQLVCYLGRSLLNQPSFDKGCFQKSRKNDDAFFVTLYEYHAENWFFLTYPENFCENERQHFVNVVHVLWESVKNVTNEMCIEKGHGSFQNASQHGFVNINRGSSAIAQQKVSFYQGSGSGHKNHHRVQMDLELFTRYCLMQFFDFFSVVG